MLTKRTGKVQLGTLKLVNAVWIRTKLMLNDMVLRSRRDIPRPYGSILLPHRGLLRPRRSILQLRRDIPHLRRTIPRPCRDIP